MRRVDVLTMARGAAAVALYAAVIGLGITIPIATVDRLATAWLTAPPTVSVADGKATPTPGSAPSRPIQNLTVVRHASLIPTSDEWADKLRDPVYWSKQKTNTKASHWSPGKPEKPDLPLMNLGGKAVPVDASSGSTARAVYTRTSSGDTYRTVCVRLCDGAFFPISFSTTSDNFAADAAKCEKTCSGGRLYTYRNPGSELGDMESLKGEPYRKLKTAFLFRTTFDEGCKCRAHPWEETSRDQHRVYALEAQKSKGDKGAATELTALTAKLKQAEAATSAEKKRADAARTTDAKRRLDQARGEQGKPDQPKGTQSASKTQRQTTTDIRASAAPETASLAADARGPKSMPDKAISTAPRHMSPVGMMSLGAQRSLSPNR